MNEQGLVSTYTLAQFQPKREACNESLETNTLNRVFVDLFNRVLIGHSVGEPKDANLVQRAFASIPHDLRRVRLFHTDRGREFTNRVVGESLRTFGIGRSLSGKGCPYDNAVAEATFKMIKTEFVQKRTFADLNELEREFRDYVHWFNHSRVHGTRGYESPVTYKKYALNKLSSFVLTIQCEKDGSWNFRGHFSCS